MGLALLTLLHNLEKTLNVELRVEDFLQLQEEHGNSQGDLQVYQLARCVEMAARQQNPSQADKALDAVRAAIADYLELKTEDVPPDAWLMQDLRLDE